MPWIIFYNLLFLYQIFHLFFPGARDVYNLPEEEEKKIISFLLLGKKFVP